VDINNTIDQIRSVLIQADGKIVGVGSDFKTGSGSDFALARFNGETSGYDVCLQDDSNGNLLQINSTTGNYIFTNCRKGVTVSGIGTLHMRGCKLDLQSVTADHRLSAAVNTCSHVATASLKISSISKPLTIADSDTTNNTCACR
jgi:hypothetical protein